MGCRYCGKECYSEFCCLEHRLSFNQYVARYRNSKKAAIAYATAFILLCVLAVLIHRHLLILAAAVVLGSLFLLAVPCWDIKKASERGIERDIRIHRILGSVLLIAGMVLACCILL